MAIGFFATPDFAFLATAAASTLFTIANASWTNCACA